MIIVKRTNNNFIIKGHADYADIGFDILCASVSSIIITSVNCIMNIDNEAIMYSDDGDTINIEKLNSNHIVDIILNTMYDELRDLSLKYKENIKIESEE